MNLQERFDQFDDDFLKFKRIENPKSKRPDLHAFLLLEEIFPGRDRDLICSAAHDAIWLDINEDEVGKLTDDQILELVRCGVRLDTDDYSLCMFA